MDVAAPVWHLSLYGSQSLHPERCVRRCIRSKVSLVRCKVS
uniref:Uncharacterized protein n=1 Tax=Arundo donax TaxID=35708 RepID=A0A0A9GD77_ARUDO